MASLSDRELLEGHIAGDSGAFRAIIARYGPELLGYISKMVNDCQLAEDLFQETFKKVHLAGPKYRGDGNFKNWLYKIASNTIMDNLRKKQNEPATISLYAKINDESGAFLALADDNVEGPERKADLEELKLQVRAALAQLSSQQRAVVIMAYYQTMAYKEIAQVLDISVNTVKTHMLRAMQTLAGILGDRGQTI